MDHITNDTSLIGPCDVIPVEAQNPRFPVVGHRMILTVARLLVSGVAANEGTNIFVSAHKILIPSSQPIYSSSFKQQQLNSRMGRCNERKFTHRNSRS